MIRCILLIVILSLVMVLNAQMNLNTPNFNPNFNPNFQLRGFLNPDNMQMNHTMSFMSGVSSGGGGFYQSAYTNHLRYQLRPNLRMGVDVSFVNLGTMSHRNNLNFNSNNDNHNIVVPAFSLEFKPSAGTTLYFEYRQVRGFNNTHYGAFPPNREWWN